MASGEKRATKPNVCLSGKLRRRNALDLSYPDGQIAHASVHGLMSTCDIVEIACFECLSASESINHAGFVYGLSLESCQAIDEYHLSILDVNAN